MSVPAQLKFPDPDEYVGPGKHGMVGMLGHRIQAIAEANGGRAQLARFLGVPRKSVANWCTGICEPSAYHLRRIAHQGGVTVDFLLCDRADEAQERLFGDMRGVLSDVAAGEPLDEAATQRLATSLAEWLALEARFRRPAAQCG